MNEKDFISKIQLLKSVKPDEDWALLAKKEILSRESREENRFLVSDFLGRNFTPALATVFLLIVGVFAFFQYDAIINRQDAEIKMAKEKEIEELSLALGELREAKTSLRNQFAESIESKPREEAIKIARDFAPSVLEIEDKEDLLASSLGVMVGDDVSPSVAKDLALFLIEDSKERSLTEENKELLIKAESAFEEGDYRSALLIALDIGKEQKENDFSSEDENEDEEATEEENRK